MAILPMKHIEIIASQKDAKNIVDLLQRFGTVDVTERDQEDVTEELSLFPSKNSLTQLEKTSASVDHAIALVEDYSQVKKPFLSGFAGRQELTLEDFEARSESIDETMKIVYDIEGLDRKISSERAAGIHAKRQLDAILPWEKLDIPMLFEGTEKSCCIVGQFPEHYNESSFYAAFCQNYTAMKEAEAVLHADAKQEELTIPEFYTEIVSSVADQTCATFLVHKKDYQDVMATFRRMSFVSPADPTKHVPQVRIDRLTKRMKDAEMNVEDARLQLHAYADKLDDLYFLSDYLSMRHEKYDMLGKLLFSNKTFILDGFVAEEDSQQVVDALNEKFDLYVDLRDPLEEEEVPVKFKNNAFVAPMEDIVESYSAPTRGDIDPNPVASFFYYFFFGMMLSDAGYGILLMIGTLFVLLKRKPEGNNKKNMMKFFYCGLATTFWGFMYGSFFGDLIGVISTAFFDGSRWLPPIWFDPSKDPMKLLILSFVLGFVHILVGLGANFYKMWKNGDKVGALCDVGFWYVAFGGVVMIVLPMLLPMLAGVSIPDSCPIAEIGKWVAIAGVAGLLLTGGRNAKGIVGKAIGGVGSIYGVTGYFSDLLSYSRLMALGLVTGIIGSVANMIGTLFGTGVVKLIIFIPIFLFFHAINLGISALGAYVHVNRLQYVEFFAKFYEGGGTMFHPFTGNTKHFKIKEDN